MSSQTDTMEVKDNTKTVVITRSDEVQEIMEMMPTWMQRRGITIIAILLVLLLVMSRFISYPDVITGRIILVTEQGPARLMAKAPGRIEQLLVTDRQEVHSGTVLAVIAGTARYEDILRLDNLLAHADTTGNPIIPAQLPAGLQLGEVQQAYAAFVQGCQAYGYLSNQSSTSTKNNNVSAQISAAGNMAREITQKKNLLSEELKLERTALDRQKKLFEEGVISKSELEMQQKIFLQKQKEYQGVLNEEISNAIQQQQLRGQIISNTSTRNDNISSSYTRLLESMALVKQAVQDWKAKYLITSPMAGRVSFTKGWSTNQYINMQEEAFTIVPVKLTGDIIGRTGITPNGAGKVAAGQEVNVQLDNYPSNEYGLLKGKVKAISLVPEDGLYTVEVLVDPDLVTTYRKKIPFAQELSGMASIITTNRSIMQRIFHNLNKTFER